jgi:hypothetical protein
MYIGLSPEQERLRSELRRYYDELPTPEVREALLRRVDARLGPRADDDRRHGGADADAPWHGRGFAGGVNEVQRDLIALFGLGLTRAPRH